MAFAHSKLTAQGQISVPAKVRRKLGVGPGGVLEWDEVFERDPTEIATAVEMLLNHQDLTIQDADAAAAALSHYRRRPGLGFADCLLLEVVRKAGHLPLGTFDRELGKLDGAQKL